MSQQQQQDETEHGLVEKRQLLLFLHQARAEGFMIERSLSLETDIDVLRWWAHKIRKERVKRVNDERSRILLNGLASVMLVAVETLAGRESGAEEMAEIVRDRASVFAAKNSTTIECPLCRTTNTDHKPLYNCETECVCCQEKLVDVYLPACGHACLCTSCLHSIAQKRRADAQGLE